MALHMFTAMIIFVWTHACKHVAMHVGKIRLPLVFGLHHATNSVTNEVEQISSIYAPDGVI